MNLSMELIDLPNDNKLYHKYFYEIVKELMYSRIKIKSIPDLTNEIVFEPVEIEFYLLAPNKHDDPYVHCSPVQLKTHGQLYVHKKSAHRGGIDITFGKDFYGGILLKAIKVDDEFITGQTKVRQKLLVGYDDWKRYNNQDIPVIIEKKEFFQENIYLSRRIGLSDKESFFQYAPYRFVRADYLQNGKPQLKTELSVLSHDMNCTSKYLENHSENTLWEIRKRYEKNWQKIKP